MTLLRCNQHLNNCWREFAHGGEFEYDDDCCVFGETEKATYCTTVVLQVMATFSYYV